MKVTKQPAVTETQVVEIQPARIILELSVEEAKALGAIVGRVTDSFLEESCVSAVHGLRMRCDEIPRKFNHVFYNKIIALFS